MFYCMEYGIFNIQTKSGYRKVIDTFKEDKDTIYVNEQGDYTYITQDAVIGNHHFRNSLFISFQDNLPLEKVANVFGSKNARDLLKDLKVSEYELNEYYHCYLKDAWTPIL